MCLSVVIVIIVFVAILILIKRRREKYLYDANYAKYGDMNVDIGIHPLKAYLGAYPRVSDSAFAGAYPDLVLYDD